MSATTDLSLTDAERNFLYHFNAETFNPRSGPAVTWLGAQSLDWTLMSVFQRWGVMHVPDFIPRIDDEDSLPPFEVPWSSREEFLARVQDFLQVYPDLRPLVVPSLKVGISA